MPVNTNITQWLTSNAAQETSRHRPTGKDALYDRFSGAAMRNPVAAKLLRTLGYNVAEQQARGTIRLDGSTEQNVEVQKIAERLRNVGILKFCKVERSRLTFAANLSDQDLAAEVNALARGQWLERGARQIALDVLGSDVEIAANLKGYGPKGSFELDLLLAWPTGAVCVVEAKSPREVGRGLPRFRKVCDQLGVPDGNAIIVSRDIDPSQAADARAFHGVEILDGNTFAKFLTEFDPGQHAEVQGTTTARQSASSAADGQQADAAVVQIAVELCESHPGNYDLSTLTKAVRDRSDCGLRRANIAVRHLIVNNRLLDVDGAPIRRGRNPIYRALPHDQPETREVPEGSIALVQEMTPSPDGDLSVEVAGDDRQVRRIRLPWRRPA